MKKKYEYMLRFSGIFVLVVILFFLVVPIITRISLFFDDLALLSWLTLLLAPIFSLSYAPCGYFSEVFPSWEFNEPNCYIIGILTYALLGVLIGYLIWRFKHKK